MFLYFLEGVTGQVTLKQLQDLGLGYAFDGNPATREVSEGPSGGPGTIVAAPERMKIAGEVDDEGNASPTVSLPVKYVADQQTWGDEPSPLPGVWVGYWTEHRPTPGGVERFELLNSYALDLCDGQTWRFPAVREPDPETGDPVCRLPSQYRMTPQRKLVPGKPLERVAWLWEATEQAWQAMVDEQDVSNDDLVEVCGQLLTANYYASDIELAALGAFGGTFAGQPVNIVGLCLGYSAWAAWKEARENEGKSHSATTGPSTPSGSAA